MPERFFRDNSLLQLHTSSHWLCVIQSPGLIVDLQAEQSRPHRNSWYRTGVNEALA